VLSGKLSAIRGDISFQTDWEEVKEEMVGKGLDASVADKIGNYVNMNGKRNHVNNL